MPVEFGLNGHNQEAQTPESSIPKLIRLMRSTTLCLQERKPDGVQVRVENLSFIGSCLEVMESRHIIPFEFEEAPINSARASSLGLIIHNPVQLRIDVTASTSEVRDAPDELQELFGEMGTVLYFPVNASVVLPYSARDSEDVGVVFAPTKPVSEKVGVILTSDEHCEPKIIGNGVGKQRQLQLANKMQFMRSIDSEDHKYTQLIATAGFWIAGILNERMNYC